MSRPDPARPADLSEAKPFPRACVASPHYLASAAGLAALAKGGNAVDAAVAANLTLGVVAPYFCGYGGDLFAIVWRDGVSRGQGLWAYNGSGRAPKSATPEAVLAALAAGPGAHGAAPDRVPPVGPLPVTVPGAVDGWFALLERFGTRSFGDLAGHAIRLAEDGFLLSRRGAAAIERSKARFGPGMAAWWAVYGAASAGAVLRQPDLARTIRTLAADGPAPFYRGPIGDAIASCLRSQGGLMTPSDLAEHAGDVVAPLSVRYRGVDVVELPPNTQGVAPLEALAIVEAFAPDGLPPNGALRQHILIEAMKLALADRDARVTDPGWMSSPAEDLLEPAWVARRADGIDAGRASGVVPREPARGGTAYLCAADGDGMLVSLIQSNYMGFGSGVTVPGWGINMHNRGAYFSLDPAHPNAIAPGKRTLHTLIPAMAFRNDRPWLVFGTMGGDGQAQTHLQLLARMIDDGNDPQRAIDAPRWLVSMTDGSVLADERLGGAGRVVDGLRDRGHRVDFSAWFDPSFGHAHAIEVTPDGYLGATDPRAEGAVLGL